MSIRTIRERLNEAVEKVPYVGKLLAAEIKTRDLAIAAVAAAYHAFGSMNPAKAGPKVNVESMWGENEDAQTMTLDTKIFGNIAGNLDWFLRNRTGIDMDNENAIGPSITFADLNYEILPGLDIVVAAKLPMPGQFEPRAGLQYTYANNGFLFYTLATRKLNENPNTEWKFDLGYGRPINGNWGWRTNWEQWLTFPDGQTTTTTSRIRLGATYAVPGSGTVLSFGPAVDINNIQNGDDAAVNPRAVMPGAYVSVQFK